MVDYIGALDQGTTSTRFMVFDRSGAAVSAAQREHQQICAAYAASLAVGFYKDLDDLRSNWKADRTWTPKMDAASRETMYRNWKKAVTRSFDWLDPIP